MYNLAHFVLPPSDFADYSSLFVRREEGECVVANHLANARIYKFDTWMNVFAPKKHYYYCELGEIFLCLNVEGEYRLQVTGSNKNAAFHILNDILVDVDCQNDCCVAIPNARNYEAIYCTIIEDKARPVKIKSGAWGTDVAPKRTNKLAIVSCTFKREAYINKNIGRFEAFLTQYPELRDRMEMVVADNGRTLDTNRSTDKVRIVPNRNLGGAGGFARGLMEVVEQDAGYTRVLFMDDDVEILPESFYRTLLLCDYLKEEYKESYIQGAMFNLHCKNWFVISCHKKGDFWTESIISNMDMYDYYNIMKSNDIDPAIFDNENTLAGAAWWYCCFDINIVRQYGYPIPVFIRCDDTEWGWRAKGYHHISMNGINAWHSPFDIRISKIVEFYYLVRNLFFLDTIYHKDFKVSHVRRLKNDLKYLLSTYDYVSLELYMRALQDILKGSDVYRENPEEQFAQLNSINQKAQWYDCSADEVHQACNRRYKVKKYRKILYKRTNRGIYCYLSFLFRRREIAIDCFPPVEAFTLVKEVKVYNRYAQKYEIRKFDRKKLRFFQKECSALIKKITKNYDRLESDFAQAYKEFRTPEFWKNYLKTQD